MINSLYKETFHLKRRPIEKQVIDLNEELLNKQNTPRISNLGLSLNIFQRVVIPLFLLFRVSLLSRPKLQNFFGSISIYCPKIFITLDLLHCLIYSQPVSMTSFLLGLLMIFFGYEGNNLNFFFSSEGLFQRSFVSFIAVFIAQK